MISWITESGHILLEATTSVERALTPVWRWGVPGQASCFRADVMISLCHHTLLVAYTHTHQHNVQSVRGEQQCGENGQCR